MMSLSRASRVVGLVLAPLLLGSTCSPSDPGCEFDETCEPGAARACINYCLPVWTPDTTGGFCPVDACTTPAFAVSLHTCPEGFFCRPVSSPLPVFEGLGDCVPTVAEFGETCDPELRDDSSCSEGTACFPAECARPEEFIKATGLIASLGGVCLTPTREGGVCDSNLASGGIDPLTDSPGCSPCESGTVCLANSVSGRDGPPDERRCTRACDDGSGSADPELCACGTSECRSVGDPVIDPITGDDLGAHFCTPCEANLADCDIESPNCCDGRFASCRSVTTDLGVSRNMCCRIENAPCDTAPGACCPGTRCEAGRCERCAREGEDPSLGCCEGYVEFASANGTECRQCALGGFTCSDERLAVIADTGDVTSVTIAETEVPWYLHQEGAGGDITMPGRVAEVRYDLTDQHRAYLFPHALSGAPTTTNWSALLLPSGAGTQPIPSAVGVPSSTTGVASAPETLTPVDWDGVRVYDVGSCSQMIRWPLLANVLALQVNRALAQTDWGLFGADPFTPGARGPESIDFSVRPLPSAHPRLPLELPHGPLVDDDRIAVHASYESDSAGGCAPATLIVDAVVALRSRPAALDSRKAVIEDAVMATVGCVISADGERYECQLPELSGPRPSRSILYDLTTSLVTFPRPTVSPPDAFMTSSDPRVQSVRCAVARGGEQYRCVLPVTLSGFGAPIVPAPRFFNRAVFASVEAVDWYFELDALNAYVEGVCILDPYVEGHLRTTLIPVLEDTNVQVSALIGQAFGTSLSTHFEDPAGGDRITPDELIPCGDPASGGDDLVCQSRLQLGGRRHRCSAGVTNLVNSSGQFVCDVAHLEVRRMFVRPEGIELVFAEGPDDPQHDLLQFKEGIIAPGSRISDLFSILGSAASPSLGLAFDPADPLVCSSNRWSTPVTTSSGTFDWFASTLLIPRGQEICAFDDENCTGLCPQYGTTCERARAFGLDELLNLPRLPSMVDLTCNRGTCVAAP